MTIPRRLVAALAIIGVMPAAFGNAQGKASKAKPILVDLETGAVKTVRLERPRILYSIGRDHGLGALSNFPYFMAELGPSRLVVTEQGPDALVTEFFRDSVVRVFGRRGAGPGEYESPMELFVDPITRERWIVDASLMRVVRFTSDGKPAGVVSLAGAGRFVSITMLSDGVLVAAGASLDDLPDRGSGADLRLNNVYKKYDRKTGRWTTHPGSDDSTYSYQGNRWIRRSLAPTPDGKFVALRHSPYEIELIDPKSDFRTEVVFRRRPPGWPTERDLRKVTKARSRSDRSAQTYGIDRLFVDSTGLLWVVAAMPEQGARPETQEIDPRTGEVRQTDLDGGYDYLIEVIDLKKRKLVASFQLDAMCRWMVAPGTIACNASDDPYPRVDVVALPLPVK